MPKTRRQIAREVDEILANPLRGTTEAETHLSWGGRLIPIDPTPRTIKPFELGRSYVVHHRKRLYTIVHDTQRGEDIAHPAEIEQGEGSPDYMILDGTRITLTNAEGLVRAHGPCPRIASCPRIESAALEFRLLPLN